jgi:hypothetical protein
VHTAEWIEARVMTSLTKWRRCEIATLGAHRVWSHAPAPHVQLHLTEEESAALLALLTQTIESDRYPLSPRVRMWREIRARFSDAPPEPPSASPPTPEERDPGCSRAKPGRKSVAQLVEDEWANPREPAG